MLSLLQDILQTSEHRHRLIDRMIPLVEENKALKATVTDLENGIKKAQDDLDLVEMDAADLEI